MLSYQKSLPPMKPVRVIVFDAYGTLLDVQSMQVFLTETFGEQGRAINQIWRQKQLSYTWLRTLMGAYRPFSAVTAEALNFACASVGIQLQTHQQTALLAAYDQLSAFPSAREVLATLGKQYPLAVLSNADEGMLHRALAHNDLTPFLTNVLSANQLGQFKPVPAVYQLATEAFQCQPEEILFVSGNAWDVNGAKSYGFQVAWLNRSGQTWESLDQQPDWEVDGLETLRKELI